MPEGFLRKRLNFGKRKGQISLHISPVGEDGDDLPGYKADRYSRGEKEKVPAAFAILSVTVIVCLSFMFVKWVDARLPTPLMRSDIGENPTSFIEERAKEDLHKLVEVGPRASGSYVNDVETVQRITAMLDEIRRNATLHHLIDYNVQKPEGAFWLDDDEGYTGSYSGIVNLVAKLEPRDLSFQTGQGILLNCHLDTKPGCIGATDDLISCSVMLEVLRVLSSQPKLSIRNKIVFLFNGAEEFGLQAAHGFVQGFWQGRRGHPWAENLTAVLNLEGAGGGGRELLFQTAGGPSEKSGWLLSAYTKVPHPYGQVFAEEVFKAGLVPSDTDFRVFRDYGNLAGLDIAYIKNGWVYHTDLDIDTEIPPGSLQNMGDNVIALLEHLGNADLREESESSSKDVVFFDVLGLFFVVHTKVVGIVINVIVSLVTIAAIIAKDIKKGWKLKCLLKYLTYIGSTLLSWGCGVGVAVLIALFLNGSGYPKPFYPYPSLSLVIFTVPVIFTQILVNSLCLRGKVEDTLLAGKMTLALILFIVTFLTRSGFLFVSPLLFGIPAWFAGKILLRGWPRATLLFYLVIGELLPLTFSLYWIVTLADIFVPIMGRSGSDMNANLYFGLIVAALTVIIISPGLISFFVCYDKLVILSCFIISFILINPMIVFGFMGKIPYQEKTPMRITINDIEKVWHGPSGSEIKRETGYWWWPLDADTDTFFPELTKSVPELKDVQDVDIDYENCEYLYCTQPFIWPTTESVSKIHWLTKQRGLPPALVESVNMTIEEAFVPDPNKRSFDLFIYGPPHMTIVLSPGRQWEANISIVSTAGGSHIEREGGIRWKGRKVYYIQHGTGYQSSPRWLRVDFTKLSNSFEDSFLEVQLTGLFWEKNGETITPEFADFLNRHPSWTMTAMSWSTVMKMYSLE